RPKRPPVASERPIVAGRVRTEDVRQIAAQVETRIACQAQHVLRKGCSFAMCPKADKLCSMRVCRDGPEKELTAFVTAAPNFAHPLAAAFGSIRTCHPFKIVPVTGTLLLPNLGGDHEASGSNHRSRHRDFDAFRGACPERCIRTTRAHGRT